MRGCVVKMTIQIMKFLDTVAQRSSMCSLSHGVFSTRINILNKEIYIVAPILQVRKLSHKVLSHS